jgi:hypothetical protein
MENYPITIRKDEEFHHFEVGEYPHHDEAHCKYKIFENGVYVASFEPDINEFLHICQNPGGLDEELLYLLADKIEVHHPHGNNENIKKLR